MPNLDLTPEERARLFGSLTTAPPGMIAALLYHVPRPDGDHDWPTEEEASASRD
jgi:hypothetical protein